MTRATKPATVHLRMSHQLHDALRAAADAAGCSLNGFAVQILAAAAGDAHRFRDPRANEPEPAELERHPDGSPKDRRAQAEYFAARSMFMEVMAREYPNEWPDLVIKHEREDPGYFVEWRRFRERGHSKPSRAAATTTATATELSARPTPWA